MESLRVQGEVRLNRCIIKKFSFVLKFIQTGTQSAVTSLQEKLCRHMGLPPGAIQAGAPTPSMVWLLCLILCLPSREKCWLQMSCLGCYPTKQPSRSQTKEETSLMINGCLTTHYPPPHLTPAPPSPTQAHTVGPLSFLHYIHFY